MRQTVFAWPLSPYYVALRDWFSFRLAFMKDTIDEWIEQRIMSEGDLAYGHPLDPVGVVVTVEDVPAEDIVPQYMIDDMKIVFNKYNKDNGDIIILPEHYLFCMGITEDYFTKRGIKTIVFPDNILLKPSLVKTTGRW